MAADAAGPKASDQRAAGRAPGYDSGRTAESNERPSVHARPLAGRAVHAARLEFIHELTHALSFRREQQIDHAVRGDGFKFFSALLTVTKQFQRGPASDRLGVQEPIRHLHY